MKAFRLFSIILALLICITPTAFAKGEVDTNFVTPVIGYVDTGSALVHAKGAADGTAITKFPSDSSRLLSGEITLPATIGNLHTHTFSDTAIGFTLKPRSVGVRYAVNATVAAVATDNDGTSTGASLAIGGIANADTVYTHTLPEGASRTLTLKGTTASPVVELVEF